MNCRDKLRFAGGDSVYYKPPPGVVERIETNAIRVFPCAVALLFVPTLKPDQFIHGVFSNTFWAACISTAVAARVVCGPRLIFPLGPTEIGRGECLYTHPLPCRSGVFLQGLGWFAS